MCRKGKWVYVVWIDSWGRSGWNGRKEYEDWSKTQDLECRSMGCVVSDTDERITIAMTESGESYADVMIIPKCAMLSITEVIDL